MVVHATQMSVGSPAGRVVTLMVSLSPIHRPVMALHMRPVYTVLLGHGQRGLLGGRVPVPVAPVHAQKSDLWRPIRLNDTEDASPQASHTHDDTSDDTQTKAMTRHSAEQASSSSALPPEG